jgi:hypothetical protein
MLLRAYALYCLTVISLFIGVDYFSASLGGSKESHIYRIFLDTSCHALLSGLVWFASTRLTGFDTYPKQVQVSCISTSLAGVGKWYTLFELLKRNKDVLLALLCGSAVDIDHFIAAGSASIAAATSLPLRPWGHALLSGFAVSLIAGAIVSLIPKGSSFHTLLSPTYAPTEAIDTHMSVLVFTSYFVHLLRDAVRRGLWICTLPYLSTSSGEIAGSVGTGNGQSGLLYLYIGTPAIPLWAVLGIYCVLPVVVGALLARISGGRSVEAGGNSADEKSEV